MTDVCTPGILCTDCIYIECVQENQVRYLYKKIQCIYRH